MMSYSSLVFQSRHSQPQCPELELDGPVGVAEGRDLFLECVLDGIRFCFGLLVFRLDKPE
jgi:hypothetical protein